MKKLVIGIVILLAVIVSAAIIVPQLIPVDTYKKLVSDQVRGATGRELDIRGKVSMSVLPWLALELNDVTFSNAPGSKQKHMVKLSRLALNLKLFPLLSGNVEVGKFILQDPAIFLEVDRSGRANWEFQAASPAGEKKKAEKSPAGGSSIGLPVSDIRLGEVGIRNGTVHFSNAKTGETQKLSGVNLSVSLPSLDSPFSAKGEVTWNKKKVTLETGAGSLRSIIEGKDTKVSAKIGSEPLNVDFAGSVRLKPSMRVAGQWGVRAPSVRNLAAWAGQPIAFKGEGFGLFEIKGKVTAQKDSVSLDNVDIQFDQIKGKAKSRVRFASPRPSVEGSLELERLDLNPYLPEKKPAAAAPGKAPAPSQGKPASSSQTGPAWSDAPIDFSPLRLVDADLAFGVKAIIYDKIQVGESAVTLKLKNGKMNLDLARLNLYKGTGQTKIYLDSTANPPTLTKKGKVSGIQALPFLKDAMQLKFLSGNANTEFSVSARGRSQLQLVKSLGGTISVQFLNGAIEGVNLGAMFRNVKSAFLDPKARETQKTDFSELSATFQIQNGVMRTGDLLMKSPLLRLTGKGAISLPPKTMDMRLEPKLVFTSKGQGGATGASGIKVPIIVKGPWDNLSYRPDIAGIIKSPPSAEDVKGLIEGVTKGGKKSKTDKVTDTLKGLFR